MLCHIVLLDWFGICFCWDEYSRVIEVTLGSTRSRLCLLLSGIYLFRFSIQQYLIIRILFSISILELHHVIIFDWVILCYFSFMDILLDNGTDWKEVGWL